nr:MAG TPA: hypothetical protein [Caudoviricetes sp.]
MLRRRTVPSREVNFVRSLISTGTQVIDTQIVPGSETVIEASLYIEANHKAYENYFGCSGNQLCLTWNANHANRMRIAGRGSVTMFPFVTPNKMNIAIDIAQRKATVNEEIVNLAVGTYDINTTMCIFAKKWEASDVLDVPGIFKLYSFAMTKAGKKVIDLYPALDDQGIACLYDMVSRKYFHNSGTGEFEYEQT